MDIDFSDGEKMNKNSKLEDLKILIVDDEKETRTMVRNMLSEIGVTQIFDSPDGKQGLDFMDAAPDMVNLVICDWNMPHLSGVELLRQLRSVDTDLPFLMVTGRGDMGSVIEAKTSGVNGYIVKPFSKKELEDKIIKIMQNKSNA